MTEDPRRRLEQSEQLLLKTGRHALAALDGMDDVTLAAFLDGASKDPEEQATLVAVAFTLIHERRQQRHAAKSGHAAQALGAVAGATGHTGELFEAARVADDVRAVEKSVETGDPKYAARRAKNVALGRGLGKAGAWRKLWK